MSIEGQGHFLTLAQSHLHLKIIKTGFSQKWLGHFEPNFILCLAQISGERFTGPLVLWLLTSVAPRTYFFIAVSESTNQTVLCCGNCSCKDDCWKTANCCPDKENIKEEPVLNCRSSVIKPIPTSRPSNFGYHVIDTCPPTEVNDTLVANCIANDLNDLMNLVWVFDKHQELTYKNKYCALCHHVNYFVKWQLRVKCNTHLPMAGMSPLFMLDDRCELKLEKPENTTAIVFPVCTVTDYNHCNQTGLWATYNADIERSCDIYHSPYFVESILHGHATKKAIKTYQNVFCFICNSNETLVANAVCVLSHDFGQVSYLIYSFVVVFLCVCVFFCVCACFLHFFFREITLFVLLLLWTINRFRYHFLKFKLHLKIFSMLWKLNCKWIKKN